MGLFRRMREEVLEVEMVAGFDLMPGAEAAVYFEHELRRAVDAAQRVGFGLRVGDDSGYPERRVGEKHIERNLGIVHPKIPRIRIGEDEDHSRVVVEMLAKHQAALALLG